MRHILKVSLVLSTALVSGIACSSAAQVKDSAQAKPQTIAAAENSQGYAKPGADVRLSHDFSGKLNPGQVGNMNVKFIMPPTDGRVRVSFTATEGLDILSGGNLKETALSKAAFISPDQSPMAPQFLQFRAQEDGVYYVNAFIDVFYAGGQKRSRVITMPISVGSGISSKPVNNGVSLEESGGQTIAVMSASETIEN